VRARLSRSTPLSPRNAKRWAERWKRNFCGPFPDYNHRDYIVQLPCVMSLKYGVDPAHVIPRSRGGDWSVIIPLTRDWHRELDEGCGKQWELFLERHQIDLLAHARRHAEHTLAVACQRYPERAGDWREAFDASRVARS
jgi:hypothetical protein